MSSVQIVTNLAERITRLFDDAGASQVERYSALDVARALLVVSEASVVISPCSQSAEGRSGSEPVSD